MGSISDSTRSTSAILFADIAGYSRLMGRDEEQTSQRVIRAFRLIRSLICDYGGEVRQIVGDGVFALFKSATSAVEFAIRMQSEFRNDIVWNSESDPIAFRIGINLGEVREVEVGLHGQSINVAARIQSLAEPGGICISDVVRKFVGDKKDIAFHSLGYPKLKNIDEEVEVFAITEASEKRPAFTFVPQRDFDAARPLLGNSIAMLQLVNLSGEPTNEHLCDGITADIITNLTRFGDLHVIAQRSSSMFRDRTFPPSDIGERLGARYLVDGSFQRAGSKVRIQVQLLEAHSGQSLWSERFDGDLSDIFAFQDELTSVIAARLSAQVASAEGQRLKTVAPSDLEAYGLILRGRDVYRRRLREANLHARRLFEQATELDAEYARAYVGISRTLHDAWRFNWAESPKQSLSDAIGQAELAIRLAPADARGHAALGSALLFNRQHDEALAQS